MCRCEVYGCSPNVLITRPPASFLDSCCDQKLRYDLEWPKVLPILQYSILLTCENVCDIDSAYPNIAYVVLVAIVRIPNSIATIRS